MARARWLVPLVLALAAPAVAAGQARPMPPPAPAAAPAFDWSPWASLLETYATADGGFRYAALRRSEPDRARLDSLVAAVGAARVDGWTRDARLAFYLNAYNLLVVHAVLASDPIASVMAVEGFFDRARHRVAGADRTLNELENDVIRGGFREPRIHFALNCASASCPPLARAPYAAATLDATLERQARAFVRASTRVDRVAGRVVVSRLFEWYGEDFGGPGGARRFVAARLDPDDAAFVRDAAHALTYAEYDWALNARR